MELVPAQAAGMTRACQNAQGHMLRFIIFYYFNIRNIAQCNIQGLVYMTTKMLY